MSRSRRDPPESQHPQILTARLALPGVPAVRLLEIQLLISVSAGLNRGLGPRLGYYFVTIASSDTVFQEIKFSR